MLHRRVLPTCLLAVAVSGLAETAHAATTVDPNVIRALDFGDRFGSSARTLAPQGRAPVLIELDRTVTKPLAAKLAKAGVRASVEQTTRFSRFVATSIDRKALEQLSALPEVRRITHVPPRGPLPLDHTTKLLHVAAARGATPDIDQITGRGMLVADIDSNADVFHPHFFHGDAGYFDWIDVNDDGVFEPGIDAIDLDASDTADATETAHLLRAATYARTGGTVPARGDDFDPSLDWVYLDEDGNGERDTGAEQGFYDNVPAFGEPLFVPDDVNQNGRIDVGERFVRLGTSKFRKVYTAYANGWVTKTEVYERGKDLSAHRNELGESSALGSDASHGTGVLSILLGDVPLVGRRWVGVAPEAEVVLAADLSGDGAKGAAWMLAEKPDVALWEMAPWTGMPLDGTDAYSQLVDTSAEEDGVAHACPVGNTGGSRKHAQVTLPAGQTTSLTFDVPAGLEPMYVQVSFNIRGAEDLGVRLRAPDGTEVDVTGSAGNQLEPLPGIVVYPTAQTTSRGTYFVDTILYAYKAQTVPMPIGSWEMSIEGDAESDARLDAYVMDEVSRWGEGVTFPHEVATDATTVGAPAVADHCIAVGAFTGHPSTDEEPWFRGDDPAGHVRSYSGRGPRIDGVERLDIVAPDNPFAAAPRIEDYFGTEIPAGAFWVFGGTSGAGPHVAGVATLLAQTGVRGDAAREAIRNGAIRDALTQSDAHAYGAGRLSAAGALGVQGDVEPPEVSLHVVGSAVVGEPALLSVVASDPGHPASSLLVRWDDGYDGTWDTEYAAELEREVVHEQVGRYPYKVRVRNPGGRVAEAVLWLDVGEAPPIEPDAGAMDAGTGGSDAGGPPAADASRLEPGGGCGCRFEGTNGPAPRGLGWFALLASLLLLRRRR